MFTFSQRLGNGSCIQELFSKPILFVNQVLTVLIQSTDEEEVNPQDQLLKILLMFPISYQGRQANSI